MFNSPGIRAALVLIAAGHAIAHARVGADERVGIVGEGASPCVIAWAEDAHEPKITEAARLMQSHLAEATGVKLPIVREADVPAGAPAIYLGRAAAARRAGLPVDGITGWSYLHRAYSVTPNQETQRQPTKTEALPTRGSRLLLINSTPHETHLCIPCRPAARAAHRAACRRCQAKQTPQHHRHPRR